MKMRTIPGKIIGKKQHPCLKTEVRCVMSFLQQPGSRAQGRKWVVIPGLTNQSAQYSMIDQSERRYIMVWCGDKLLNNYTRST